MHKCAFCHDACVENKRTGSFEASRPSLDAQVQQRHAQSRPAAHSKANLSSLPSPFIRGARRKPGSSAACTRDATRRRNAPETEKCPRADVRQELSVSSEISSPFTRLHRNEKTLRNLDFVWFSANQWMRNLSPPPPPTLSDSTLFSFAMLDGPSASEASCFVSQTRLQHPCAAPGKETPHPPPPSLSWALEHLFLLSIFVIMRNFLAQCLTLSYFKAKFWAVSRRSEQTTELWMQSLCLLKWQDNDFIQPVRMTAGWSAAGMAHHTVWDC